MWYYVKIYIKNDSSWDKIDETIHVRKRNEKSARTWTKYDDDAENWKQISDIESINSISE